jgi:hypothetical protein
VGYRYPSILLGPFPRGAGDGYIVA